MYLYHFVPKHMQGTILYPLSEMKTKLPQLFKSHASKYQDRKDVPKTIIPGLGTWNDVIHLSPVEPRKVFAAMKECGAPADYSWRSWQVDASTLDPSKLVIMVAHKEASNYRHEFLPFTKANYLAHNEVPEITKQHYREARAKGEQPFTYGGVPHVFYKGTIDTKKLKIVSSA